MTRSPRGNGPSGFAVANGARDIDFDAARDEEFAVAGDDRVARTDDRREPGRAETVHGDAGDRVGKPGEEDGHARDIPVVLARLIRAADERVLDLVGRHAGALHRALRCARPAGGRDARLRVHRRSGRRRPVSALALRITARIPAPSRAGARLPRDRGRPCRA